MRQIKKEICIVGGSGFVGKSILDCFGKGLFEKFLICRIYIICRNPSKITFDKRISLKNIEIIKGDISKIKKLPNCDYYIYSAEQADIKTYKSRKIILFYKKSVKNFCKIIKNQKKNSKILYISSGSLDQKKDTDYKNYNKVKKNSETIIKDLLGVHNKIFIARCYSFISEFLPLNKHFAIGNFIKDALDKRKKYIKIKSNIKVLRSYMYSEDLGFWLVKILLFSKKKNCVYKVGSDQVYEIGEVAKIIGKLLGKKTSRPAIYAKKIDRYVPNINSTKKELKLNLKYDLMKSIKITLKKIIKNEKN